MTTTAAEPLSELHATAQRMAMKGWSVFPLMGKVPRPHSRGFLDSSRDVSQVDWWWGRQPQCNVGLATGQRSGVWVLDLDVKEDANGILSVQELEQQFGELPQTLTVQTGSGGLHLYWKWVFGSRVKNRQGVRPGIDVRGDGGYVVAPPSIHPDTLNPYRVVGRYPIAVAPQWLIDIVAPPKPKQLPQPAPFRRVPADEYEWEKQRRLREDPGTRERLGLAVSGEVCGAGDAKRVRGVQCLRCGRPSVWWPIYPQKTSKAMCSHRNSCGWTGGLEEYL